MKTIIEYIPHADEPKRTVAQWLFETESGDFIAGGYAEDENGARNDAAIWIKGKKVTISCDCHWTDDNNQERITPGPCTGTVSAIDFREDARSLTCISTLAATSPMSARQTVTF